MPKMTYYDKLRLAELLFERELQARTAVFNAYRDTYGNENHYTSYTLLQNFLHKYEDAVMYAHKRFEASVLDAQQDPPDEPDEPDDLEAKELKERLDAQYAEVVAELSHRRHPPLNQE